MECTHGFALNKACAACRRPASPEYVSTLDRTVEKQKHNWDKAHGRDVTVIKEIVIPTDKLDDIIRAQKYILDKLHNMDRFLRTMQRGGYTHSGEFTREQKNEVIKDFLLRAANRELTEDERKLFPQLLTKD